MTCNKVVFLFFSFLYNTMQMQKSKYAKKIINAMLESKYG
jgi:hypothetical protein